MATLSNVIGFLDTTKDLVPLDVAKGVLSTLSSILTTVKNTVQNKDDFTEVLDRCEKIANSIERSTCGRSESDTDPTLVRALDELKSSIDGIEKTVKAKEQRALRYRVFSASVDRESIAKWKEKLDSFLRICDHELIVHIGMEIDYLHDPYSDELDREAPPPRPPMFFGRDDLVRVAIENLRLRHVVLVGPGGIGKSTIAKAMMNKDSIIAEFQDRRFFVRFDNIDASQITLDTFVGRIADVLGVKSTRFRTIRSCLASRNILIVLDNAETFQDAVSGADRIAEAIDELGALPSVRIILTTRNRRVSTNLRRIVIDVPTLDPSAAREVFTQIYWTDGSPAIIDKLLSALDFHPLSVNLLAHVATENQWTLGQLLSAWEKQQTDLLEVGGGKLQSLSVMIELSLASSSIKQLGNDARHVMQVAAFLPQEIIEKNLKDLFPTIPNVRTIVDALCRHSLLYHKTEAHTMLSPIRLHISNTHHTISLDLTHIRRYYHRQLNHDDGGAWITTEDANLELLIAHDLCRSVPKGMELVYRDSILGDPEDTSHIDNQEVFSYMKARCLWNLGDLAVHLVDYSDAIDLFTTAQQLFTVEGKSRKLWRCSRVLGTTLMAPVTPTTSHGPCTIRDWQSCNLGTAQPQQHFETGLSIRAHTYDNIWGLIQLSAVEVREGSYLQAGKLWADAFSLASGRKDVDRTRGVLWAQAALASDQGHFDRARDILTCAFGEMATHGWQSTDTIAMTNDCSARNELFAGEYKKARELFAMVVNSCDETSDLELQTRGTRALGEIALLERDFTGAREWFTKTISLCDVTGTHPDFLYIGNPHAQLKESHEGWKLFLEGHLPSA
ncbi:hypothetical protein BV22DRAFT_1131257 [Leucogyrophana mollusca]|uniref:Uncharacterized protein n=1 Tax=Leucogyrophana mollusca TaxID=85980 RepID=A0ACB8BBQ2_9AGAM|nr:hypothetical protein BV22DRAFT_1131257 [Leucogyrophana mollusca]